MCCGKVYGSIPAPVAKKSIISVPEGPCDYTQEMLTNFKENLTWFKSSGLLGKYNVKPSVLNRYLGLVITSMNINKKCTYKDDLEKITDLVDLIITLRNA